MLFLMKKRYYYYSAILFLLIIAFGAVGYEYIDEKELEYAAAQPTSPPAGKICIVVRTAPRLLEVYSDGQIYKRYRIAVGKHSSPSPIGEWQVVNKDYSNKDLFGTRWIGLNVPWGSFGIHGTNRPWSIGQFASHGCIRMRNQDVEELFEWVPVGTPVKIIGPKTKIPRTLKFRMQGQDEVWLQLKLKELGYLREQRADGLFGRDTEEAVKVFQKEKGLESSGVVDKKMLNMLGL